MSHASSEDTSPLGPGEGVALVHAAQDDGDWKPVADWLARHPEHASEVARVMQLEVRLQRQLPARSFSDLPGTALDGFELREVIGKGGAGVVFRGFDTKLNRVVAVKFIHTGDPERFRVEAERVAGLEHENIVPVYAFGETDRGPYLVMPLMPGGTLGTHRRARPGERLPAMEAARLVRDVARGVHHAHQRGLIHRDLKPLNVLLDERGAPRIADFGLARPIDASDSVGIAGTYAYMAPEQARGDKGLTVAVDVWALGATLYELLTGELPFGSGAAAVQRVLAEAPYPMRPTADAPAVPKDLEAVCLKCLEKQPADRYATALDVAEELDRFLRDEPVRARPPGFWDWLGQLARKRPDPRPNAAWPVTAWFGLWTVAVPTSVYVMARTGAPAAGIWVVNGAIVVGLIGVLWWYMLRRFRHVRFEDRHSLVIAAGTLFAHFPLMAAYVPLSLTAPARDGLGLYPHLMALSGLGFFILGSTHWSRFFLIGLAVLACIPLTTRWPDESPLIYGGTVAAVMWYWSWFRRMGFEPAAPGPSKH